MFDGRLRQALDPWLNAAGVGLARLGWSADGLTVAGCAAGLSAAVAVAFGAHGIALGLFLVGRCLDGLDGAVARATVVTDRGGYLDIVLDFAVYAALPLAFAVADPQANALAAAVLLAAIVLNGSAFLAFATIAAKRGLTTSSQGRKSLYFMAGLAGGFETIIVYTAMMAWPRWFPGLALAFGTLCLVSGVARIATSWRMLQP